jgi:hypothetical protein
LVGSCCPQRGIESQIGDFITFRQARLDIVAALAFGLGLGTATGFVASQAI